MSEDAFHVLSLRYEELYADCRWAMDILLTSNNDAARERAKAWLDAHKEGH
jgi:hypothetical protein